MLRTLIILVLAAHGVGHSIGVAGGWANSAWGGSGASWLLTPVLGRSTGFVEGVLFVVPMVGFVVAAGLLLGNLELWRPIALASAAISLLAIAAFPHQLPLGSVIGAAFVNAAILIGLLLLHWPSAEVVGA
jgi:hypothetical protein